MKKSTKLFLLITLLLVVAFGIFLCYGTYDGLTMFIAYGIVFVISSILCVIGIYNDDTEKKIDHRGRVLAHEEIVYKSNVIQFDEMGSPLRLCIVRTNKKPYTDQVWLDTTQRPNDVVLEWEKNDEINTNKH